MDDPNKGKVVAVIGLGSAGIQTICHMLSFLKYGSIVVSIHDPETPALGIGESTNPSFISALERGIDFNIISDLKDLDATYKLGTEYQGWRQNDFINPLIQGGIAIHFNTNKLKDFAIPRLKEKWGDKFHCIEGSVTDMYNLNEYTVAVKINDEVQHFDYVIDCRGFPDIYEDYTVLEPTVNHCLVHNINQGSNWMNTRHTATENGWIFGIPLQTRTSYGYLFNNTITSLRDAQENFSKHINVPVEQLNNIEYKFKSYFVNKLINGNIIYNGNRAVFFEPMFANSLYLYSVIARLTMDYMYGMLTDVDANNLFTEYCTGVKDMIAFHYHGGSNYNTNFWNEVKPLALTRLKESKHLQSAQHHMKEQTTLKRYSSDGKPSWVFGGWPLGLISYNFGYDYFCDENNRHFIRSDWDKIN